ncbi:hypothetical protein RhiirA5_395271 [Rhizophagus irregularis]|uniref:Uncharacterized protein n=1 Tax=Rhizophagus irregularis TaxID=588596 RepID=A0A2I1EMM4_9GLOM|nr:hypothetical protein RhiirA5_395270 [Rhizophagus irregularis]PKC15030.1 hypothetical protein RhiirA5_395271 [Rhizophagus irregularis]PKC66127.1 hypothetical protein RhiirA1_441900 [Rhizophagus irregularis]PKY23378.1 hypothetical protein RhiirB3_471387 [Rhizophagus irregularis]
MVSPNELAAQASCYGLPYGIFGIFCWCFTFFSAALVHANCPILMPWRWGKKYRVQGRYILIISSILILGPAINTCFKWSHVIFALVSNNWNGFATTGSGMASSIFFFIGKRLLFLDTNS